MFFQTQHGPRHGRALAAILAVAAGGWLMAFGEDTPTPPPANPLSAPPSADAAVASTGASAISPNSTEYDYSVLERFINLPPERITELRKVLEYLEKMPPAEREALRQHLQLRMENFRQVMTATTADTQALPRQDRDVFRRYVMTLFPEDDQALLQKLKDSTTPEARKAIIQGVLTAAAAHGIKPNPDAGNRQPPGGRANGRGQGNRGPRGEDNGASASKEADTAPAAVTTPTTPSAPKSP